VTTATAYAAVDGAKLSSILATLPDVSARLGGKPNDWRVREVGDGNLNLVFIVEGPAGGLVVKQALPYVRLVGESWPLPLERSWYEYNALVEQSRYAPGLTPEIFHFDREQAMIVMEYLSPHIIMRKGLIRGIEYPRFAADIAEFLAQTLFNTSALAGPAADHKRRVKLFASNIELCRITEDLVFTDPYREAPLNRWTSPQLDADKRAFENDSALKVAAQARKYQFLTAAQALIHGDLHTGSIMLTSEDTRVIDPEFSFIGPMGFDVGAVIVLRAGGARTLARRARRLSRLDSQPSRRRLERLSRPLPGALAASQGGRSLCREPHRIPTRRNGDGKRAHALHAHAF
jgi:5-methylthioribose kinase